MLKRPAIPQDGLCDQLQLVYSLFDCMPVSRQEFLQAAVAPVLLHMVPPDLSGAIYVNQKKRGSKGVSQTVAVDRVPEAIDGAVALAINLRDYSLVQLFLQTASHNVPANRLKLILAIRFLQQPAGEDKTVPDILEAMALCQVTPNGCFSRADPSGDP